MDEIEVTSGQRAKRRRENDDEDSVDKDGAGCITRCKRLKTSNREEFREDCAEDDAATELSEGGSFDENKSKSDNYLDFDVQPIRDAFTNTRGYFENATKSRKKDIEIIKILTTDIPERMQLRSPPVVPTSEEELISEAQWIYQQAFERRTISVQDSHLKPEAKKHAKKSPETVSKIVIVLDLMKNQHLEVPFIAFYRKEYVLPELNINDLWRVYKFDAEWCRFCQIKYELKKLFELTKLYQSSVKILTESLHIQKWDIEQVEKAQSLTELCDYYSHYKHYHCNDFMENSDVEGEVDVKYRGAALDANFVECDAGLRQFVKEAGLFLHTKFSEEDGGVEMEGCPIRAYSLAKQIDIRVKMAAENLLARKIAMEPLVKRSLRKMYMAQAKISVRPTRQGVDVITENHPLYTMKFLKNKPVKELIKDDYLKIVEAQNNNLVIVTFSKNIENDYFDQIEKQLFCDEQDRRARIWNRFCRGAVEKAMQAIVREVQNELHCELMREGREFLIRPRQVLLCTSSARRPTFKVVSFKKSRRLLLRKAVLERYDEAVNCKDPQCVADNYERRFGRHGHKFKTCKKKLCSKCDPFLIDLCRHHAWHCKSKKCKQVDCREWQLKFILKGRRKITNRNAKNQCVVVKTGKDCRIKVENQVDIASIDHLPQRYAFLRRPFGTQAISGRVLIQGLIALSSVSSVFIALSFICSETSNFMGGIIFLIGIFTSATFWYLFSKDKRVVGFAWLSIFLSFLVGGLLVASCLHKS